MRQIGDIVVYLIFIGLFFSNALFSIAPWCLLAFAILVAYKTENSNKIKLSPFHWACFLYFFILLISIFWTTNLDRAHDLVLRKIYFVSIPLSFILLERSGFVFSQKKVFQKFCIVLALYCLFSLTEVLVHLITNDLPLHYLFTKILRSKFQETISFSIHHAYLGMFLNFAIFVVLSYTKGFNFKKLFLVMTFISVLYINSGLSSLVGFFIILNYWFLFMAFKKIKIIYKAITLTTLVICFVSLAYSFKSNYYHAGYWESPLYRTLRAFKEGDPSRVENWKSSYVLIKENFLFGTGIGDDIDELQKKREKNSYVFNEKLNQHSQYLAEFSRKGLVGFLVFLALISSLFFVLRRSHLGMGFSLLLVFSFVTENILDRQRGIIFFLMISMILITYQSSGKKTLHSK